MVKKIGRMLRKFERAMKRGRAQVVQILPSWLKLLATILPLLFTATFNVFPIEGERPMVKLQRTLEMKITSNSTALVRLSSTPVAYEWPFFRDYIYNANKSYWHSYAVGRIIEMFNLSRFSIVRTWEEDARSSFITEMSFGLNESRRYESQIGILNIVDSFKLGGEYLSSLMIESEKTIYDCIPRYGGGPRVWYYTHRVEWRNADSSYAPDQYILYFKIPLELTSNLPPTLVWGVYLSSRFLVRGNGSTLLRVYANEGDKVSVEKVIEGPEGVRYVCENPEFDVVLVGERTFAFDYTVEYKVSLKSSIQVEAINVMEIPSPSFTYITSGGSWYTLPHTFWAKENASFRVIMKPEVIEGSFTNHVFDGWADISGERLGTNFTVRRPLELRAIWREELNSGNIMIVLLALAFAFVIPELRKRISIEIVWEEPSKQDAKQES